MSTADIHATFISRKAGNVILEAALGSSGTVAAFAGKSILDRLNPFSTDSPLAVDKAPKPSTITYNTDITQFTDSFDFSVSLASNENFELRSHDFIEFSIELPEIDPTTKKPKVHQIGAGFIEDLQKISNSEGVTIQGNGRDFFGQLMNVPFEVQLKENITLNRFMNRILKDSYLEQYLALRHPELNPVRDLGSFSREMLFFTDLEQRKGQVLQKYAVMGINLVYMNRLGQIEILGRPGTLGSTAKFRSNFSVGELIKGGEQANVMSMAVRTNFSNVFSSFKVFYSSGEAILDQNVNVSPKFENTDPRVKGHILQPGFTTFNSSDLVAMGGSTSFATRIKELAKAELRKSNRDLNSVIVTVDNTGAFNPVGVFIPFQIGQQWVLKSNEREFTSPQKPDGTDTVDMLISAISYQAKPDGTTVQLRFIERDALL